jgi:hypothetical protein
MLTVTFKPGLRVAWFLDLRAAVTVPKQAAHTTSICRWGFAAYCGLHSGLDGTADVTLALLTEMPAPIDIPGEESAREAAREEEQLAEGGLQMLAGMTREERLGDRYPESGVEMSERGLLCRGEMAMQEALVECCRIISVSISVGSC